MRSGLYPRAQDSLAEGRLRACPSDVKQARILIPYRVDPNGGWDLHAGPITESLLGRCCERSKYVVDGHLPFEGTVIPLSVQIHDFVGSLSKTRAGARIRAVVAIVEVDLRSSLRRLRAIRDDSLHRVEGFGYDDETRESVLVGSYAPSSSSSALASFRSAVSKPSVNQL
jgi:hypothetical protein